MAREACGIAFEILLLPPVKQGEKIWLYEPAMRKEIHDCLRYLRAVMAITPSLILQRVRINRDLRQRLADEDYEFFLLADREAALRRGAPGLLGPPDVSDFLQARDALYIEWHRKIPACSTWDAHEAHRRWYAQDVLITEKEVRHVLSKECRSMYRYGSFYDSALGVPHQSGKPS